MRFRVSLSASLSLSPFLSLARLSQRATTLGIRTKTRHHILHPLSVSVSLPSTQLLPLASLSLPAPLSSKLNPNPSPSPCPPLSSHRILREAVGEHIGRNEAYNTLDDSNDNRCSRSRTSIVVVVAAAVASAAAAAVD